MTAVRREDANELIHRLSSIPPPSTLPQPIEGDSLTAADEWKTWAWWRLLCTIAVFNVLLWTWTAGRMLRHGTSLTPTTRAHLTLSAVYVAVCAFRSVLPRIDLERTCLWDTPLSSMVLGRSGATVAEVSFAAQIALFLYRAGEHTHLPLVQSYAAYVVVPALTIAQGFCWSSVVSLVHVGHAIEEAIWAAVFAGVGVCLALIRTAADDSLLARVSAFGAAGCAAYVAFMVAVDVPMYVRRWQLHRSSPKSVALSCGAGFRDALYRRHPTAQWAVWRPEVAWLTGYFSSAVWVSVALVHFSAAYGPIGGPV